ncbi:MAG: hypothetical protein K2Y32_02665 [Candidatus Obscuribacterales bacterium]|nr:hypothetical protein [Candidatus Obscuribacterales bacterium]
MLASKQSDTQDPKARVRSRTTKFFQTILGSTSILIIILIMCLDAFVLKFRPLFLVQIPGIVLTDQQATGAKFTDYINQLKTPEILILGSSLILHPAARVDNQIWKLQLTKVDLNWYSQARYFDQLLQGRFNTPVNSYNLALAGLMVSEAKLLLEKSLESGRHPRVLLLFVAPREFIDHHSLYGKSSRVYQYFSQSGNLGAVRLSGNFGQDSQTLLERFWTYYRLRGDYNRVATALVCDYFGRAPSLAQTKKKYVPSGIRLLNFEKPQPVVEGTCTAEVLTKDLESYKARYLPIDEARLNLELNALKAIFDIAKEKDIKVAVINMPISIANLQILPPEFINRFENKLNSTCIENKVPLLDLLTDKRFSQADFVDSVHLNAAGGKKLFNLLVGYLEKMPDLKDRLAKGMPVKEDR